MPRRASAANHGATTTAAAAAAAASGAPLGAAAEAAALRRGTLRPKHAAVSPEQGAEFCEQEADVLNVGSVLSWWTIFFIYFAYTVLALSSWVRYVVEAAALALRLRGPPPGRERVKPGYVSLFPTSQFFWLRYMYGIIRDCFERPVMSVAGGWADVMDRKLNKRETPENTWKATSVVNLGSYNYLGFAQKQGPINDAVADTLSTVGAAAASPALEAGYTRTLRDLETLTAEFVGKPAAFVVGMGFATNSTSLPALAGGKGTLIISDNLNHASIVTGARDSHGACVRVFKHNDASDLENVIRDSIVEGQPRTHRPWDRIIIIIEGIYSMEGEICDLPRILAVKKKYRCYLYVDEAHSIGALGARGRGVCDHFGIDPADIDVLMGTYTKAFGSVGGYIAGSREMVDYLRASSYGSVYSTAMAPACARQALEALRMIMGLDGTPEGRDKIFQLKDNANYFRTKLDAMGLMAFGAPDSPVIPMMLYHPSTLGAASREFLARKIAIVVVGYPVTPLLLTRVRFCLSASHTRDDIDYCLRQIGEIADMCGLRFRKPKHDTRLELLSKGSSTAGRWISHVTDRDERLKIQQTLMDEFKAAKKIADEHDDDEDDE